MPVVGLEPTRCCHQRILSPSRLPFHHTGGYWDSIHHIFQNSKSKLCQPGSFSEALGPRRRPPGPFWRRRGPGGPACWRRCGSAPRSPANAPAGTRGRCCPAGAGFPCGHSRGLLVGPGLQDGIDLCQHILAAQRAVGQLHQNIRAIKAALPRKCGAVVGKGMHPSRRCPGAAILHNFRGSGDGKGGLGSRHRLLRLRFTPAEQKKCCQHRIQPFFSYLPPAFESVCFTRA